MSTVARGHQDPRRLKLSHDRKVSPQGYRQPGGVRPGRWVATVANSFGLPAGDSCPGRTPFCEACYAVGSENSAGVRGMVEHNLRLLLEAGTVEGMAALLAEMVARYVRSADRKGLAGPERLFRIHWDGDFFSVGYAEAWARVIRRHPDVAFWAYTRSFAPPVDVVPVLAGVPNLRLYLSADRWNAEAAHRQVARYPDVLLAPCAQDYRSARDLAHGRPSIPCPENAGRMGLMDDGVGACVRCQVCPQGKRDVLFATTHREVAWGPVPVALKRKPGAGRKPDPGSLRQTALREGKTLYQVRKEREAVG